MPDVRTAPLGLVLEQTRRFVTAEDARESLGRMAGNRLFPSPELERNASGLNSGWPGQTVLALASGRALAGELVARCREKDLPLLWALVASGLLSQEESSGGQISARDEEAELGRPFSPREEEARSTILAEHRRVEGLDHYALLGVSPDAGQEEIRQAYLELARRFHSDAWAGLELGRVKKVLAGLFQRIGEASQTLSDVNLRAEYDIYLERTAAGLPTDVGAILTAEDLFLRGQAFLKTNKTAQALELFDQAIALNHAEPEFHAYRAYALYRVKGSETLPEVRQSIEQALEEAPRLASAYVFLGLLSLAEGATPDALGHFEKALDIDPQHEQAQRELRALRRGGKERKSLLGRLLGR